MKSKLHSNCNHDLAFYADDLYFHQYPWRTLQTGPTLGQDFSFLSILRLFALCLLSAPGFVDSAFAVPSPQLLPSLVRYLPTNRSSTVTVPAFTAPPGLLSSVHCIPTFLMATVTGSASAFHVSSSIEYVSIAQRHQSDAETRYLFLVPNIFLKF